MRSILLLFLSITPWLLAHGPVSAQEKDVPRAPQLPAPNPIIEALEQRLSVDFEQTPLTDAVRFFHDQLKIDVKIHEKALEDGAVPLDTRVTLSLTDVTAGAALTLILRQCELTFRIQDSLLLVTTPDDANAPLVNQVYNVADLVGTADKDDLDMTIEMLVATVAPQSWDEDCMPQELPPGRLVISHTFQVHREIEGVFAALREAEALSRKDPAMLPVSIPVDKEDQKIDLALSQRAKIDVQKTPLVEVAAFFSRQLKLPVLVDQRALEDADIDPRTEITYQLDGGTLRFALDSILAEKELTWVAEDGVLVITSPDDVKARLKIRVYPVRGLLSDDSLARKVQHAAFYRRSLAPYVPPQAGISVQRLPAGPPAIPPQSFQKLTGQPFIHPQMGIRFVPGGSAAWEAAVVAVDAEAAEGEDYERLTELIRQVVESNCWSEVGGPGSISAHPHTGTLVVAQTMQIHHQLEQLLTDIRKSRSEPPAERTPAVEAPELKIYHLRRSTADAPALTESQVAALVTTYVEPASWAAGGEVSIQPALGMLIIRHKPAVHVQIENFIAALRMLDMSSIRPIGGGFGGGGQGGFGATPPSGDPAPGTAAPEEGKAPK